MKLVMLSAGDVSNSYASCKVLIFSHSTAKSDLVHRNTYSLLLAIRVSYLRYSAVFIRRLYRFERSFRESSCKPTCPIDKLVAGIVPPGATS